MEVIHLNNFNRDTKWDDEKKEKFSEKSICLKQKADDRTLLLFCYKTLKTASKKCQPSTSTDVMSLHIK